MEFNVKQRNWSFAWYLLSAKQCIDTLMYIDENIKELSHLNVRLYFDRCRRDFYINLVVVLDKSIPVSISKSSLRKMKQRDYVVRDIYYERDKNEAHKDDDYTRQKYNSISEEIDRMKSHICHVKDICTIIPDAFTLDFVSHDHDLYRLLNTLSYEDVEKINEIRYPFRKSYEDIVKDPSSMDFKIIYDIEDLRNVNRTNKSEYGVVMSNGLVDNETLQNHQKSCVLINMLNGLDVWCTFRNLGDGYVR